MAIDNNGATVAKATKAGKLATHIRVSAKRAGFRRGGRDWPAEAITVPVSEFSKAQLAQIRAEPQLIVTDVDAPAAE